MNCLRKWRAKRTPIAALGLVLVATSLTAGANAAVPEPTGGRPAVLAQAMIPRTGMMDAQNPMPMKERYLRRFPQPARVGDLVGMPLLDLNSKTLGHVQQIVQTTAGEIEFIIGYSRWWGWFGRPVAVPLEALGIEGGNWCHSICNPANMRPHLYQPMQQCASRCLAVRSVWLRDVPARRLRSSRMSAYSASWAT